MLLDANVLLYAVDHSSTRYETASAWLVEALTSGVRVGLPWQSIGAFLRIATHPRVSRHPLPAVEAWGFVESWLALEAVWIPPTTDRTAAILGRLLDASGVTANLVPDAMLAALAIEHGVPVVSADSDFARFPELRWVNPFV